jgi:hypothetical protein
LFPFLKHDALLRNFEMHRIYFFKQFSFAVILAGKAHQGEIEVHHIHLDLDLEAEDLEVAETSASGEEVVITLLMDKVRY